MPHKILAYLKQHKVRMIIIAVIVIALGYYWYRQTHTAAKSVQYITAPAQTDTVIASVTGTGQVAASNQLDIKPQTDGQFTSVPVKLNQQVKKGDVLGIIDQQSAANTVAQAQANLQQAQANYDKLMAGATQNAIDTQKLAILSAQQALDQDKTNYSNVVAQQQLSVSKASSTLLSSNLLAAPSDTQSTGTITVSGSYNGNNQGQITITVYNSGDGLHYSVSGLGTAGTGLIQTGLAQSIGDGLFITFGTTGSFSVSTTWTINIPNTNSASYLNNLNAFNSAVQAQTQALENAQASIVSDQNALDRANLSLQNIMLPPTGADIASAKAQITSAQAQLANAQTTYQNTVLRAPFDGSVATLAFNVGDKITAGTTFATIITNQQMAKITLNEVDVAKVQLGQKATMTFDAIDGLQMTGQVGEVDTLGAVSQGVVTYGVQIVMDTTDPRIKPGMSVSASIITKVAADVLTVPNAAVKSSTAGGNYVQVLVNGQPQNKTVTIGIADDTNTQILSGINAGDQVVTQTITTGATSSTTGTAAQTGTSILGGLGGGGAVRAISGGGGAPGR